MIELALVAAYLVEGVSLAEVTKVGRLGQGRGVSMPLYVAIVLLWWLVLPLVALANTLSRSSAS